MAKRDRRTVAVDFDGVIHSYSSDWIAPHIIPDPPVDGSIEWLHRIIQNFDVNIFTTRARTIRGRMAIRRWLLENGGTLYFDSMGARGIEEANITYKKLPAIIYIDDRAFRFDGSNFPEKHMINNALPWWKRAGGKGL